MALHVPDTAPPTAEEIEAFGSAAHYAEPDTELWPDNLQSYNVFVAMLTQWHCVTLSTASSAEVVKTGMRYEALREVWMRCKIPHDRRDEIFDDLRVMEDAAMRTMKIQRDQRAAKRK